MESYSKALSINTSILRKFLTYGVDEKKRILENTEHQFKTILDFLFRWNTRRVGVIDTRANLVGVFMTLESLEAAVRGLKSDDISIKTLNRVEDGMAIEIRFV